MPDLGTFALCRECGRAIIYRRGWYCSDPKCCYPNEGRWYHFNAAAHQPNPKPGVRDGKVIAGQWVPDEEADA